MKAEGLQRTLYIGLGETATRVVERALARVTSRLGPLDIIEGLTMPDQAGLAVPAGLEARAAAALRRISRLDHLAVLAARGLSLRRTEEVHLVLVAEHGAPDPDSPIAALKERGGEDAAGLARLAARLHDVVYHTLTCDSALTGLLLLLPDPGAQLSPEAAEREDVANHARQLEGLQAFNRGCFVASLTNESGLVVGDVPDLVERAAEFLSLLLTSGLGTAVSEPEWADGDLLAWQGTQLASFGLASARWPGCELAQALAGRWAQAAITWLEAPPVEDEDDETEDRRPEVSGAQRLVAAARLSPPLVAERLAELMPDIPNHLADEVPDPPWPWQVLDMRRRLESVAQGWEEAWVTARGALAPATNEIAEAARAASAGWLLEGVAWPQAGALALAGAHLQALDELLQAFIEGVEAQVEEHEADLMAVERRLSTTAATLASLTETFPPTPLDAALRWGTRPFRWLKHWAECREAQAAARQYAHLLHARFITLRAVWLYEAALPFYRAWAEAWRQERHAWRRLADQVARAGEVPELKDWAAGVGAALDSAPGPWTSDLVEALYRAALESDDLRPEIGWQAAMPAPDPRLGPWQQWSQEDQVAETIARRLADYAARALAAGLELSIDQALGRQLADEKALENWLSALVAQASPFVRYDETALAQEVRSEARRETWLLAPGGAASPLAGVCRAWPQPPAWLETDAPAELVAVAIRRGLPAALEV